eukprot:2961660-Amphidinium_carterae.1
MLLVVRIVFSDQNATRAGTEFCSKRAFANSEFRSNGVQSFLDRLDYNKAQSEGTTFGILPSS